MDAYMYILKCADGTYYTGSTKKLVERIHQYYPRIEDAFLREKQVQRWSAAKKEALIKRDIQRLKELAACKNLSHFLKKANPSKE